MNVRAIAALVAVAVVSGCGGVTIGTPAAPATVTVTPAPTAGSAAAQPPRTPAVTPDPSERSWPAVIADVRSGVARLQVATCTASGSGSGLVVGPNLVLTAAHVVHGARSVTVGIEGTQAGGRRVIRADVVGINRGADLALARTSQPVTGHVFTLAAADPSIGEEVALIGYPFGDPRLSAKFGHVSAVGGTQTFSDGEGGAVTVSRLITTDAAINPGNSGGPVIAKDGRLVGIVSGKRTWAGPQAAAEGVGWAVSAAGNAARVSGWRTAGSIGTPSCAGGDGRGLTPSPSDELAVSITSRHSQAGIVAESLALHGTAINQGQYSVAYDLFTRAMKTRVGSLATWSRPLSTSYWRRLEVREITTVSARRLQVRAGLRTEQAASAGYDGQTCSIWNLEYTMALESGVWHIDKVRTPGAGPAAC